VFYLAKKHNAMSQKGVFSSIRRDVRWVKKGNKRAFM